MQCRMPEDQNSQMHHCENLKACKLAVWLLVFDEGERDANIFHSEALFHVSQTCAYRLTVKISGLVLCGQYTYSGCNWERWIMLSYFLYSLISLYSKISFIWCADRQNGDVQKEILMWIVVEKSNKWYNIANKVYSIEFTATQQNKCIKYC